MSRSGAGLAGMILLIISFIVSLLGIPVFIFYGSFFQAIPFLSNALIILLIVQIVGAFFNLFAMTLAIKKMNRRAGIFAIIAAFLPPLNLLALIGGILCLISKEAKD